MNDALQSRVSRGAQLLDSLKPGWREMVQDLQMASNKRCVLGQLFGGFTAGLENLGVEGATDYGFDIPVPAEYGYGELTFGWLTEISGRKRYEYLP